MRMHPNSVTRLAREGRLTMQVPDSVISFSQEDVDEYEAAKVDMPDSWFEELRGRGKRPCLGREQGYLFWSREGYAANRSRLREAFDGTSRGTTWEQFEAAAIEHFRSRDASLRSYIDQLESKLEEARGKME